MAGFIELVTIDFLLKNNINIVATKNVTLSGNLLVSCYSSKFLLAIEEDVSKPRKFLS